MDTSSRRWFLPPRFSTSKSITEPTWCHAYSCLECRNVLFRQEGYSGNVQGSVHTGCAEAICGWMADGADVQESWLDRDRRYRVCRMLGVGVWCVCVCNKRDPIVPKHCPQDLYLHTTQLHPTHVHPPTYTLPNFARLLFLYVSSSESVPSSSRGWPSSSTILYRVARPSSTLMTWLFSSIHLNSVGWPVRWYCNTTLRNVLYDIDRARLYPSVSVYICLSNVLNSTVLVIGRLKIWRMSNDYTRFLVLHSEWTSRKWRCRKRFGVYPIARLQRRCFSTLGDSPWQYRCHRWYVQQEVGILS